MNKNLKLLIGAGLIAIGGLVILGQFNIISGSGIILTIMYAWPLVISLIGLLMLLKTKKQKSTAITLFIVLCLASSIYFSANHNSYYNNNFSFDTGNNYNTFNFFDEY